MTILTQTLLEVKSASSVGATILPPPAQWASQAGRYTVTQREGGIAHVAKIYDEAGRKLPRPVVRVVSGERCNCEAGQRGTPCKHPPLAHFILKFLTCPICACNAHLGRDLMIWESLDPISERYDILGVECRDCSEHRRAGGAFVHSAQDFWLNREMTRAEWATARAIIASYQQFDTEGHAAERIAA